MNRCRCAEQNGRPDPNRIGHIGFDVECDEKLAQDVPRLRKTLGDTCSRVTATRQILLLDGGVRVTNNVRLALESWPYHRILHRPPRPGQIGYDYRPGLAKHLTETLTMPASDDRALVAELVGQLTSMVQRWQVMATTGDPTYSVCGLEVLRLLEGDQE